MDNPSPAGGASPLALLIQSAEYTLRVMDEGRAAGTLVPEWRWRSHRGEQVPENERVFHIPAGELERIADLANAAELQAVHAGVSMADATRIVRDVLHSSRTHRVWLPHEGVSNAVFLNPSRQCELDSIDATNFTANRHRLASATHELKLLWASIERQHPSKPVDTPPPLTTEEVLRQWEFTPLPDGAERPTAPFRAHVWRGGAEAAERSPFLSRPLNDDVQPQTGGPLQCGEPTTDDPPAAMTLSGLRTTLQQWMYCSNSNAAELARVEATDRELGSQMRQGIAAGVDGMRAALRGTPGFEAVRSWAMLNGHDELDATACDAIRRELLSRDTRGATAGAIDALTLAEVAERLAPRRSQPSSMQLYALLGTATDAVRDVAREFYADDAPFRAAMEPLYVHLIPAADELMLAGRAIRDAGLSGVLEAMRPCPEGLPTDEQAAGWHLIEMFTLATEGDRPGRWRRGSGCSSTRGCPRRRYLPRRRSWVILAVAPPLAAVPGG